MQKERYMIGKGCFLTHTGGVSVRNSTLPFLHRNDACVFFYFHKGRGSLQIEDRQYTIHEGDVFMINPSELFLCTIDETCCHERMTLRVSRDFLQNFGLPAGTLLDPFYKREKGTGNRIPAEYKLGDFFEAILSLMSAPTETRTLLAVCKVTELLSKLTELAQTLPETADTGSEDPLISRIIIHINRHFREELSVASIAETFHISPSYLSHRFRSYTGTSLWNYVIGCRLNCFNDLLSRGSSVEEACFSAGFQNYSNFFRLYRKHMKMTPTEYQKKYLR